MIIYQYLAISESFFDVREGKLHGKNEDCIYPAIGAATDLGRSYPFSLRAYEVLKDYLEWSDEISVSKSQKLVLAKIPEITVDDLDSDASIYVPYGESAKEFHTPQRLVFKSYVPGIFRTGALDCYCNEEVKELVEKAGLTGFSFAPAFFAFTQEEYKNSAFESDLKPIVKFEQDVVKKWDEEDLAAKESLSEEEKELLDEIAKNRDSSHIYMDKVQREWNRFTGEKEGQCDLSLSGFMKDRLGFVVDLYVSDDFKEDYYTFLNEFVSFRNTCGYVTDDPGLWLLKAIRLLHGYRKFSLFHASVEDYLYDRMNGMACYLKWNWKDHMELLPSVEIVHLIAARLNAKDEGVITYVKELLGKRRKYPLNSHDGIYVLRAVAKCKNAELHGLLGELLDEAKADKELCRQICFAISEGRADACQKVLEKIEKSEVYLIKEVKNFVNEWIFVPDVWKSKLYPDDIVPKLCKALKDPAYARRLTKTDDCTSILTGLTAIGFYEVRDGLWYCSELLMSAGRMQLYAVSCYLRGMGRVRLARVLSAKMIEAYQNDPEVAAWFDFVYFPVYDLHSINQDLSYSYYVDHKEDIDKHYEIMKRLADEMTEQKITFPCIAYPGLKIKLLKSDVFTNMAVIAFLSQHPDYLNEVCSRFSDIKMEVNEKVRLIEVFFENPITDLQRTTLISFLSDRNEAIRDAAFSILDRIELSEVDFEKLEFLFKKKSKTNFEYVSKLLNKQGK